MEEGTNEGDVCASVNSTGSRDTSIGSATQFAKLIISTEGGSAVVGAGGVPCSGPCDTSIGSATQSAKLINTTEEDSAVVEAGVVPCEDKATRDVKDIESATQSMYTQELKEDDDSRNMKRHASSLASLIVLMHVTFR